MKEKKKVYIKKGRSQNFKIPEHPIQAPTFFQWRIDYGGGESLISEDRKTFQLKGENLGRHIVRFVPSTIQGKTLMSAQYTGCGEDHKFIVIVHNKRKVS